MNSEEIISLNKNERYICSKDIRSIKCINGKFWITYEYGKDIILSNEDSFSATKKKKVIIQTLEKGKICLERKKTDLTYSSLLDFLLLKPGKSI